MEGKIETLDRVKEYYGKILGGTKDLKTNACCTLESLPAAHQEILAEIDDEILEKFYGCGSPLPPALEGCTVLDLGCGTGRDVYLASRLVGSHGYVVGIDMTHEQLEVAHRYQSSITKRFGFKVPNVDFRQGYIEDLAACGIADNSIDVVISNCVINLSPDKERVFTEIFRVLKPGGELYFSDVFAGRRLPAELQRDPLLYGECLGGALYIEDFRRILIRLDCPDYRVVSKNSITIADPAIEAKAGMIDFYSMTLRAFKLEGLEDICEDYGQMAVYSGTLAESPHRFSLDDHHLFITGKPMLVCGNTAAMLNETRYARHFKVIGDRSVHFGSFDCAPAITKALDNNNASGGSCC